MEGLAIVVAAIGAINWGLVGLFGFDLVAAITTAGKFGDTNVALPSGLCDHRHRRRDLPDGALCQHLIPDGFAPAARGLAG